MNTSTQQNGSRPIIVGDYLFDPGVGLLSGPSGVHYICPQLTSLLRALVDRAGQVVSCDDLDAEQQGDGYSVGVGRRVARLRNYFRDPAHLPRYIETIPGQGYRLVAPVYGSTDSVPSEHAFRWNPNGTAHGSARHLLRELGHRKVSRAMLIYTLVVWVVFQMTEIVVPALALPDWVSTLIVVLGILGFPIAATLSWIFDLTPRGLVRGMPLSAGGERTRTDFAVDFVLVAAALAICTMLLLSSQSAGTILDVSADSNVPTTSEQISPAGMGPA